ncbi:MAG: hypothetical protein U0U67_14555 [Chitinophagales bacterium]
MQKIIIILIVGCFFTECKQREEDTTSVVDTIDSLIAVVDTVQQIDTMPVHEQPKGKLAATATDEVVGKDGKTVSFTYDNNASTVAFDLNGKHIVLTSKEKVSDVPMPDGRTYSNEEFTFNDKDGIKITDKAGKTVFEEK